METLPQNAVLLIVDVQKGIADSAYYGVRNNPQAEANMARLLAAWRASQRPVVHIQHVSLRPTSPLRAGQPGGEIKDEVKPQDGELLIQKHANSAFIGTDLEAQLRARGLDTLVIVGLTTEHCVSTTARMAGNLGFRTYLVADATAAFDKRGHDGRHFSADEVHAVSLATINGEFATVVETEALLPALA
jgi:nicotinamidase-related amidase